jgi:hypothetical protein
MSCFSSVITCLFRDFFLCSTDHVECNFLTILYNIASHGTALTGYLLRNFLRHFLHEECCTNTSNINNLWSTLYLILERYFETVRTVFERILRTTNHAKQAALSRQASMHRVHKRRFGVRQWTGVSEHISSWPV